MAFDRQGDFFVVNSSPPCLLRFPADGGQGTVFADSADGVLGPRAIAFASDGDLYFANIQGGNYALQITPTGDASLFEDYGNDDPIPLSAGTVVVRKRQADSRV